MKKLSTIFKETSAQRIKKGLEGAQALFIMRYSKLNGPDVNTLRKTLRAMKSELFVVRNAIARRVLKDAGNEELGRLVDGPCGFVFSGQDPAETSKTLAAFFKGKEHLAVQGGLLAGKAISAKEFDALSKLPSRQVLLGKTVLTMKAPINKLVFVLKGNLRSLVSCLDQIKNKKQ